MSERYQAYLCNRVWVVIDNETKLPVDEPWRTREGAEDKAASLNMKAWRDSMPVSSLGAPSMVWGDDWEGRLLEILDKPLELEYAAAA